MDERALIERIYEHCEAGDIDKAVMTCLRLARKVEDTFNAVLFLRELHPDLSQLRRAFYDETRHLKKEARQFIWEKTTDQWIEERTFERALLSDEEDRNVLALGVGVLQREPEHVERSIADLRLPEGMGEFDTAAFTDKNREIKSGLRLRIHACLEVLDRLRTRCLYYASRIEGQLDAQSRTEDMLGRIQADVNNYFAARCDPVFQKLTKAASLIDSDNPEDHSLVLTTIRRAIKATADHFLPPRSGVVVCQDGTKRELGEDQYLNRLQEFCHRTFGTSTANSLLRAELDVLSVFVRRVDKIASKGVHADVSRAEARQGLVGLYMFLSNLIAKLDAAPAGGPTDTPPTET